MIDYYDSGKYDLESQLDGIIEDLLIELKGDLSKFKFEFYSDNQGDIRVFYGIMAYKHHPKMTTITELFLQKKKFRKEEKNRMLEAMNNSVASIFRMKKNDYDNAYVWLEDIYTNKIYKVTDVSLSFNRKAKENYLYTRVISYDDVNFVTGAIVYFHHSNKEFKKIINDRNKSEIMRCLELYYLFKRDNEVNYINMI